MSANTGPDHGFTEPKGNVSQLEQGGRSGDVELSNLELEKRLKNPLVGITYEQLMADVEAFAHEKDMVQHLPLLRKGALVAQTPEDYENIKYPEHALDDAEKAAIYNEIHHKWRMPTKLFLTIATCSIGACVQGWDQTGSNGATIFFPEHYGIPTDGSVRNELIVGLINAAPYVGSALIGCWLSDPVNNLIGRRGVIFVSAHFCLWPLIGSALSQTWEQQLVNRLLMGIGMGIKASTVPIYAAENAPASVRGALVMSWQMWTAFGIMLGTLINLAVFNVRQDLNWRLMLGFPLLPAIPLILLIYLCPESPRWLMKKNRYSKAWDSMNRLRHNPIQVARDIYYIHCQLEIERKIVGESNYFQRFVELFTIPRVRRATLSAFTVMIAQQMCGINIIAFYSTTLFVEAGQTQYQAIIASFGFGLINWLFAFPAFWTIDTFGRRSLLLFTFPNMMWTLLAAGLFTLLPNGTARTALVALFVYLFAAFYSPGEGPVPFTYSAEVFPLSHRELGMGFAVATCLFWAAALGITLPLLLARVGTVGVFGIYAGFNLVAWIMIFFWVPETKQRTLEELDHVFSIPTSKFGKYQVKYALPYFFKRWVFFNKNAKLVPLLAVEEPDAAHHVAEEVERKHSVAGEGAATAETRELKA